MASQLSLDADVALPSYSRHDPHNRTFEGPRLMSAIGVRCGSEPEKACSPYELNPLRELNPDPFTSPGPSITGPREDPSGRLQRPLQIPSRLTTLTSGFSLPPILQTNHSITPPEWDLFTHELKRHARLSGSQWVLQVCTTLCWLAILKLFFGPLAVIPGSVIVYKRYKRREFRNLAVAQWSGALAKFVEKWNEECFHERGLHVLVLLPGDGGVGGTKGMDVSTSKLYRYQQKVGIVGERPGGVSVRADKKEARYLSKEFRGRLKATRKGRIVVIPFGGDGKGSDEI